MSSLSKIYCPLASMKVTSYCLTQMRMAEASTTRIEWDGRSVSLFFRSGVGLMELSDLTREGEPVESAMCLHGICGKMEVVMNQTPLPLRDNVREIKLFIDVDLSSRFDINRRIKRYALVGLIMKACRLVFPCMNDRDSRVCVFSPGKITKDVWVDIEKDLSRLEIHVLPAHDGSEIEVCARQPSLEGSWSC